MRTRRSRFVVHLEGDTFSGNAILLLFCKNGSANKVRLVQRDKKTNAGFERRRLFIQFVSIQWVTIFGAQGIPRAEAGRLEAKSRPDRQNVIPNGLYRSGGGDDFKAILAGVAGASE